MDPMASHIADGCGFHCVCCLVDWVFWVDLASKVRLRELRKSYLVS